MADEKVKMTPEQKVARVDAKIATKRQEMKDLLKANKLSSKEDHSKNKAVGASYKAIKLALAELEAKKAGYAAGGKKKKGKAGIAAKYVYPSNIKTSDDKKKYRTHIRGLAKKNGVSVDEVLKNVAKYEAAAAKAKPAKKEAPAKKKAAEAPVKKKKAKPAPAAEEEETEEEVEETDNDDQD